MSSKEEQFTYQLVFGSLFIVVPVAGALIVATVTLGPASIPIWMVAGLASWLILKGPLGDALAARLRGEVGPVELSGDALADLDELRARVAELEERVDFSERLLARKDEPARLEAPR